MYGTSDAGEEIYRMNPLLNQLLWYRQLSLRDTESLLSSIEGHSWSTDRMPANTSCHLVRDIMSSTV